ncbi:MAG: HEPN domain-containing protein [Candidatus Odinarchaeia archaeon]
MGEKENRLKIAEEHLKRAKRALQSAKTLMDTGMFEDAVGRAYYGAFHAAYALLYLLGETPYSHKGLHMLFGLKVVKTNLIPPKYGRYLSKLSSYREVADYSVFTFISRDDVVESIKMAEEFVGEVEKVVKDRFKP